MEEQAKREGTVFVGGEVTMAEVEWGCEESEAGGGCMIKGRPWVTQ